MCFAPPKVIEKTLSLVLPPACREEVLGDLYESCNSSGQYVREAFRVVPMVILSRIRRTADSQVLLMQATALFLSFMGAAWFEGKAFLFEDSGLQRLAIPPVWVLFGVIFDDVYACPGRRSPIQKMRGPVLGFAFACLSQMAFSAGNRLLALPPRTMFFGSATGLLFSIGLRNLFPPITDRPAGASGPALWIKHTAEPFRIAPEFIWRLLATALVVTSVLVLICRELRRW